MVVKIKFSMHIHVEFYKGEMEGRESSPYVLHLALLNVNDLIILLKLKRGEKAYSNIW